MLQSVGGLSIRRQIRLIFKIEVNFEVISESAGVSLEKPIDSEIHVIPGGADETSLIESS
jgi:hypothetical protein